MRVALDTNILAYAEGVNGPSMRNASLAILDRLPPTSVVVPVQALGELFHVLVRKAARSPKNARAAILEWRNAFALIETTDAVLVAAADLAINKFSIWDAIILSAAAEAECRLLLSEDLQDGYVWKGVTVVNPFAKQLHPLLETLING